MSTVKKLSPHAINMKGFANRVNERRSIALDKTQQTHSGIELQEHEWKEIRKIARDMYESKQYNQDQFKIAVMAFMKYAVEYEKRIMSMINLEGPIH